MRSSRDSEPQAGIGAGVAVGGRILVVGRRVGSFEELDCGVGGTSDGRGGGDCGESWKKSADAKVKRGGTQIGCYALMPARILLRSAERVYAG